jgi:hypothetical protein
MGVYSPAIEDLNHEKRAANIVLTGSNRTSVYSSHNMLF